MGFLEDEISLKSCGSSNSSKIKFLCSFGGKIMPRSPDNQLRYIGGESRILAVGRNISYLQVMERVVNLCGSDFITVKYQLPGEDLDALVSLICDDDIEIMMEEYERLEAMDVSVRLRLFIFPSDKKVLSSDAIEQLRTMSAKEQAKVVDTSSLGGSRHSSFGGSSVKKIQNDEGNRVSEYLMGQQATIPAASLPQNYQGTRFSEYLMGQQANQNYQASRVSEYLMGQQASIPATSLPQNYQGTQVLMGQQAAMPVTSLLQNYQGTAVPEYLMAQQTAMPVTSLPPGAVFKQLSNLTLASGAAANSVPMVSSIPPVVPSLAPALMHPVPPVMNNPVSLMPNPVPPVVNCPVPAMANPVFSANPLANPVPAMINTPASGLVHPVLSVNPVSGMANRVPPIVNNRVSAMGNHVAFVNPLSNSVPPVSAFMNPVPSANSAAPLVNPVFTVNAVTGMVSPAFPVNAVTGMVNPVAPAFNNTITAMVNPVPPVSALVNPASPLLNPVSKAIVCDEERVPIPPVAIMTSAGSHQDTQAASRAPTLLSAAAHAMHMSPPDSTRQGAGSPRSSCSRADSEDIARICDEERVPPVAVVTPAGIVTPAGAAVAPVVPVVPYPPVQVGVPIYMPNSYVPVSHQDVQAASRAPTTLLGLSRLGAGSRHSSVSRADSEDIARFAKACDEEQVPVSPVACITPPAAAVASVVPGAPYVTVPPIQVGAPPSFYVPSSYVPVSRQDVQAVSRDPTTLLSPAAHALNMSQPELTPAGPVTGPLYLQGLPRSGSGPLYLQRLPRSGSVESAQSLCSRAEFEDIAREALVCDEERLIYGAAPVEEHVVYSAAPVAQVYHPDNTVHLSRQYVPVHHFQGRIVP